MIPQRFAHVEANDTLPRLLRYNAQHHGPDIALREKQLGLWRSWDWAAFHDRARLWGLGLAGLGVERGDTVVIVGDSRPDWVASAIGAHALGAKTLGLYQDALNSEVGYLIELAEARVVIAEDEEQADKMLRVVAAIPSVQAIVYCDPRGMRKYPDRKLLSREALFEQAALRHRSDPALWDRLVDATSGEDLAVLCSTSGTTSHPKLVGVSSGRFIPHVAIYCDLMQLGPDDEYVSLLPMGWIGEQFQAFYQPLVCRHKLNFVEDRDTVMADLREIAPTFMFLAPRVWEQIAADVRARMIDASPLKRRMFEWGLAIALRAVERGKPSRLAQALVMRALRDRLGFSRLRFASTGGAAMGPDTFKFFMAMGLPMVQLYGQTEVTGIYCIQRLGDVDLEAVGRGLNDDYKIRIDDPDPSGVGEIVSTHPYMFEGYYRNEAATRADLRDGWLHTGDAGYIKPSGQLVVIDRLRDLAVTTSGARFSPQYIENKLKFSPYISEAVILGDKRAFPAAIICIRFSMLSKWAEQNRMSFTTYSDLASRKQVCDLIAGEVERVNMALPEGQRLRKFVLLYKELDADDGEFTRTRKIRRGVIAEKYGDIIEAIYGDAREVRIDTEIAFQDGSRQRIRTTMPVAEVAAAPAGTRSA